MASVMLAVGTAYIFRLNTLSVVSLLKSAEQLMIHRYQMVSAGVVSETACVAAVPRLTGLVKAASCEDCHW